MTDIVDVANDRAETERDENIADIRQRAAAIPAGAPGDCAYCGEPSARLVSGACATCRDELRLP
jgi:hypothetical protein